VGVNVGVCVGVSIGQDRVRPFLNCLQVIFKAAYIRSLVD